MNDAKYLSLTQIGLIYGVSRVVVGRWLKNLGLRDKQGNPAGDGKNMTKLVESPKNGSRFWAWHKEKTLSILDNMDYPRGPLVSQVEEELKNSK
jgi:hypothetical protein